MKLNQIDCGLRFDFHFAFHCQQLEMQRKCLFTDQKINQNKKKKIYIFTNVNSTRCIIII